MTLHIHPCGQNMNNCFCPDIKRMGCYETDLKIMSVSLMKYFLKIYVNVSVLP